MKSYNVFGIYSEPFNPEILSSLMWELEITGVTEEQDHLKIFSEKNSAVTEVRISSLLNKLVAEKLITKFEIKKKSFEDKNWNELWESEREVFKATDKIIIKPTFRDYSPEANEIVITIDPKMSFGTGDHQTTKLVLNLLEKYLEKGDKVLDIGTGTAILAIAAVKLGASRAVALDTDEWCYDNSTENTLINKCSDQVNVFLGEVHHLSEKDFDLILANIQKDVLLEIGGHIKSKIRKEGIVILSGLLESDLENICTHYQNLGFAELGIRKMDEWAAVVFKA